MKTLIISLGIFFTLIAHADLPPIQFELARTSLQFFLDHANPKTGLVRDTAQNESGFVETDRRASIAATGFGLTVIVNAGEQGLVTREFAEAYAEKTLDFVFNHVGERKGWLFHFIDWESGERWEKSEYSTIDTAFMVAGALYAAQVYPNSTISKLAQRLYERMDFEDMRTEGGTKPDQLILTSSYRPELGYSKFQWKDYAECMVLYLLGLGSPTHALPAASWRAWTREKLILPSREILIGADKPLFTHQYSQLFIDFRGLSDDGVDYFNNAKENTLYNRSVGNHETQFSTFKKGFWGLSAGDSPEGYRAFSPIRDNGTVCPGCAIASAMYLPRLVLSDAAHWKTGTYGPKIWGPYGFSDSLNLDRDWFSHQVHAITVGPIFLALANLSDVTSIWSRFNQIPGIRQGLQKAGLVRDTLSINHEWRFLQSPNLTPPSFANPNTREVTLPNTWNIDDAQSPHYFRGAGWYDKKMVLTFASDEQLFLRIGAANEVADVFVNGTKVGSHRGGYTAFAFNVTPYLKNQAENHFTIRVDNSPHADIAPVEADFTFFGGLYRGVSLIRTRSVHVSTLDYGSSGVYLTPRGISREAASVEIKSIIRNDRTEAANVKVTTNLRDAAGNIVAHAFQSTKVAGLATVATIQTVKVVKPLLWDGVNAPNLYHATVTIADADETLLDRVTQTFGIREFKLDHEHGLILNDQPVELRGVSYHQDWEGRGWAIGERERKRNLDFLQDLGANAVRLAHYPRAAEELSGLDRAGMIAWSEIPLVNVVNPTAEFSASTKQQLLEMIHQLYNHPSIAFWGLYNEIKSDPGALVPQLNEIAHREDPLRFTTAATDRTAEDAFNRVTDALAFNRYDGWYQGRWSDFGTFIDEQRGKLGNTPIGVSEYGAGASVNDHADPPSQPVSGGKFHPEEWQNEFHEAYYSQLASRPYLFGHFIWNLFDFAAPHRNEGEVTGLNDKGLVTYDRTVKKDAYFFYRSHWNPAPTVYLTSRRFTVRSSATANVKVYSNLAALRLTVNGKSIGQLSEDGSKIFRWTDISLNPGTNRIEVAGVADGETYRDETTWLRK